MPSGSYGVDGYGLYDMAGNVWEWCWDWYGEYGQTAQADPRGPSSGWDRVNRGGSWNIHAGNYRVADRGYMDPGGRYDYLGFRSVLPPDQP